MRKLFVVLAAAAVLSGCSSDEIENVEAHAEKQSQMLENRMEELEAMAENRTAEAAAPLENEANALLQQINGSTGNEAKAAGNVQ
jgi:uncharacterized protein YcfL